MFPGRADDFVASLSAIPVRLLVLTARVTRAAPFGGHFFTLPRQTFLPALLSFAILTPLPPISRRSCVLLLFSRCVLIHLASPSRVDAARGGGHRSVSQHGSVSFINIRFSQRHALKADSETSLPAQQTKSPAPPSPSTPLSPVTNRYLSESDCTGVIFLSKEMA